MTLAPDRPLPEDAGAPRPGSLEHLARAEPHTPAIVDTAAGRTLSRAEHDARADALAAGLQAEHALAPGSRVAVALAPGADQLTLLFALAKLGAAPLLLDASCPLPWARAAAATAGCLLLVAGAATLATASDTGPALLGPATLEALADRHAGAPGADGRLSGEQPPADSVQATDGPRPARIVLRARTPERLVRLAPAVGDLLARVALPRGGVHLLAGGGHRPEAQFWTGVALVTGGCVVTVPDDRGGGPALLAALVTHGVTSAVLRTDQLRALVALPAALTDAADLTALARVVVDDGPLDAALVTAAADLLGEDVVHAVHATVQTGPVAHASADELARDPQTAGLPLAGVLVTTAADGGLLVTSPLTADGALGDPAERDGWPAAPAWADAPVPTGDRGAVDNEGRVRITRTGPPDVAPG